MKLAEALQERADLNRKIEELQNRVNNNILVQEDDAPAEDPKALLEELDAAIERQTHLIAAINRTNSRTRVDGVTLTELIAKKDMLSVRLHAYRQFGAVAAQSADRARGTEIRVKPVLNAAELQQKADQIAKELRLTDNLLQETNWKSKLIE